MWYMVTGAWNRKPIVKFSMLPQTEGESFNTDCEKISKSTNTKGKKYRSKLNFLHISNCQALLENPEISLTASDKTQHLSFQPPTDSSVCVWGIANCFSLRNNHGNQLWQTCYRAKQSGELISSDIREPCNLTNSFSLAHIWLLGKLTEHVPDAIKQVNSCQKRHTTSPNEDSNGIILWSPMC